MSGQFHKLKVTETVRETDDATSLFFDVPAGLSETFAWRAGQHITVRLRLEGREERRSYSISGAPGSGNALRITVKRVDGGLVSNHINNAVHAGDEIDVLAPFGGFCLDPEPRARRTHYFFAAGSGITPLFAMISAVLTAEPHSLAHLAYGNSNADSIIFRQALNGLCTRHPDRLTVCHLLSAPSLWSSFGYWRRGILDGPAVTEFISENPPYAQDTQYYVCGPGTMNGTVKAALMAIDVPAERIHMESFGAAGDMGDDGIEGVAAKATVVLNGSTSKIDVAKGQSLLAALRAHGLEPPYSCQAGVCSACRAKLAAGTVHMRARMALEDHEIEAGHILTCQARPTSRHVDVRFDD